MAEKYFIVHVITTISMGGAEKQLLQLAESQISLGSKIIILYLDGDGELEDEFRKIGAMIEHSHFKQSKFANSISSVIKLRSLLSKYQVDVIHAHLPRAELVSYLARFLCDSPSSFIISRHNSEPFLPTGNRLVSKVLSKLITRTANTVIAISIAVKEYLIEIKEISRNTNLVVIYYGIKHQRIPRRYPSKTCNSDIQVGTIARLEHQKNLKFLILSFSYFFQNMNSAKLLIAGVGSQFSELESYARSLKLAERVIFLGRVKQTDKFLDSLDLFMLTSHYEGFGLVLLEAMSRNINIVAPNCSAIPEVLGKTYPGLYDEENVQSCLDKMKQMLDQQFSQSLSKIHQNRLDFFSIEKCTLLHFEVYAGKF